MPADRFQRSFKESVLIDELLRKEKVKPHFHREGMIIGKGASSTDILRWDFSVMGAKSYVLKLSENVHRSLEYKPQRSFEALNQDFGLQPLSRLEVVERIAGPPGELRTACLRIVFNAIYKL